jgi:hypothetical protein
MAARHDASTHPDAELLQRRIHALGRYEHVRVRAQRGYLYVYTGDDDPIARLYAMGAGRYGVEFHRHTGRWEPMPLAGEIGRVAYDLVNALGPYLDPQDFSDWKSGSDH